MSEVPEIVNRDEFPPNSKTTKKVERVVRGDVIKRKKPLGRKFKETFGGDDMHSAGGYVFIEIIIPAIKQTLSDAVSQMVERMLFGEARPRSRSGRSNWTSYGNMYRSEEKSSRRPPYSPPRSRSSHDIGEVILGSRNDAQDLLDGLADLIEQFDVASVADMNELLGVSNNGHTDNRWGWTNLRDARIVRIREGYLVDLPQPTFID